MAKSKFQRFYLVLYNLSLLFAWYEIRFLSSRLAIGIRMLILFNNKDPDLHDILHSRKEYITIILRICEGAAALEVLHSFIGLTYIKTHTVINIGINNWITWGVLPFFTKKDVRTHVLLTTCR